MPDETEKLDDKMREVPTDTPEVVPSISSEQMGIATGVGAAAFAKQNPEQGMTGDEDKAWHVQPRDLAADNDEESHVRPTDNDGETVPREGA
jgi:hypothetical protein